MMEQPSSSGEWRRWGEVRSGAALTSSAADYRQRLIYSGGGHVYAIVSVLIYGFAFLLFDPVCSYSTGTCNDAEASSSLCGIPPVMVDGFWLFPLKIQCASGQLKVPRRSAYCLVP